MNGEYTGTTRIGGLRHEMLTTLAELPRGRGTYRQIRTMGRNDAANAEVLIRLGLIAKADGLYQITPAGRAAQQTGRVGIIPLLKTVAAVRDLPAAVLRALHPAGPSQAAGAEAVLAAWRAGRPVPTSAAGRRPKKTAPAPRN